MAAVAASDMHKNAQKVEWKTRQNFLPLCMATPRSNLPRLDEAFLGKVHLIWQVGDEDIEGGLRKFLDTRKGSSEKIRGGGFRKFVFFKTNRLGRGS